MKTGVRIHHNGQTVDADELTFTTETNGPVVFKVEDGTRIEVTPGAVSIYRLLNEKDTDGSPIYVVMGSVDMKKFVGSEGGATT